jgi:hypothetical protein
MSNTIKITDLCAKDGAAAFETEAAFFQTLDRGWEPEFKQASYSPGDTIRIKRTARFNAVESSVASPEDIVEDTISVTLRQFNVSTRWTDLEKQLSLNPAKLSERVFQPLGQELVATVESTIAEVMAKYSTLDAGNTPGTVLGAPRAIADGVARIREQRCPMNEDIFAALTYTAKAALWDNTKSLSDPSARVSNEWMNARMKNIAGANAFATPSIYRLTNGTIVNSDVSLSVILVAGATQTMTSVGVSKTVTAGMQFTIPDVFEVDPQTKTALPSLKMFRVAAAATSTAGEALTITLTEPVVLTGSTQNVSGAGAGGQTVTWYGATAASRSFYQNLIYHKKSVALIALPLALPEGDAGLARMKTIDGIPVKSEFWRDAGNHKEYIRQDVLIGIGVLRGNWIATGWGE